MGRKMLNLNVISTLWIANAFIVKVYSQNLSVAYFPQSESISKEVIVFDWNKAVSEDEKLALVSLQGIINRNHP